MRASTPTSIEPLLVSMPAAARALGIGESTLAALVANGELESVKVNRRRLIPRASLDEYVARLRGVDRAS